MTNPAVLILIQSLLYVGYSSETGASTNSEEVEGALLLAMKMAWEHGIEDPKVFWYVNGVTHKGQLIKERFAAIAKHYRWKKFTDEKD